MTPTYGGNSGILGQIEKKTSNSSAASPNFFKKHFWAEKG